MLSHQPIPMGNRVAVLTNGGGPGILTTDACARNGLRVPELSSETANALKAVVKRDINIGNPLDLTAAVTPEEFENCLRILAADKGNDAIISIYVPPAGTGISEIESAIAKVATYVRECQKPLLACFMGITSKRGIFVEGAFVPYYLFPEDTALALGNAVRYKDLRDKERGNVPVFADINKDQGRHLVQTLMKSSSQRPLWMPAMETGSLLKCYGINYVDTLIARTPEEAVQAAEKVGFPVAVKLFSDLITHKTEVGGVILDVKSPEEVKEAYEKIKTRLVESGQGDGMQGLMIQPMVEEGIEVIVGVNKDPQLGHVVMFGMGGIYAELFRDTVIRLHPLTDKSAREMIDSIKMAKLLQGYRGNPPADTKSLQELLLRVSALVQDHPEITEMDLNPVKVKSGDQGYVVLDARILVR